MSEEEAKRLCRELQLEPSLRLKATPTEELDAVAREVARLATVIELLTERIRNLEDDLTRIKHHLRWNEDAN